jgi:hypothetical protein
MRVKQASKHELAGAVRERYLRADRRGKATILDEFVASTGYHQKAASRPLRQGPPPPRQAFLVEFVPALEANGLLTLGDDDRAVLGAMGPATVGRRLAPYRRRLRSHGRGTTRPGTLLKQQIPVSTYTPWEEERAGFLEVDLVAHCGTATAGHDLNTLVATDVATGWTECEAIWGKGQAAVVDALEQNRDRLPFPLLRLDSGNGSEVLNAHRLRWCSARTGKTTRPTSSRRTGRSCAS